MTDSLTDARRAVSFAETRLSKAREHAQGTLGRFLVAPLNPDRLQGVRKALDSVVTAADELRRASDSLEQRERARYGDRTPAANVQAQGLLAEIASRGLDALRPSEDSTGEG